MVTLIEIALNEAPRLVLQLNNISDNILNIALNKDPNLIGFLQTKREIPESIQLNFVENKPSVILSLKNPSEDVILKAVSHNGLLLKNFPNVSERVRLEAIKQNPNAIAFIKPTLQECKLALSLNSNIENKIKDKDLVEQAKMELNNDNELQYDEELFELS